MITMHVMFPAVVFLASCSVCIHAVLLESLSAAAITVTVSRIWVRSTLNSEPSCFLSPANFHTQCLWRSVYILMRCIRVDAHAVKQIYL